MSVGNEVYRASRHGPMGSGDPESRLVFSLAFVGCLATALVERLLPLRRGAGARAGRSMLDRTREAASRAMVGYTLMR